MAAMALVFVLKGIVPFLSPDVYRRTIGQMVGLNDRSLRVIGLVSMIVGLLALYLVR